MNEVDISTILASAIHESKNRIGTLLYHTHSIKNHKEMNTDVDKTIDTIEESLKQLNDEWVEYLYLYNLSTNVYNLLYDSISVSEFLDDQVFALEGSATSKGLSLSFKCDDDLVAVFDERLITSAVTTSIYNAFRFAKKDIILTASIKKEFLVITIEDDGSGFLCKENDELFATKNTGLGLYFCELSAKSHAMKETHGYITKEKSSLLGGACLKIFLPQ